MHILTSYAQCTKQQFCSTKFLQKQKMKFQNEFAEKKPFEIVEQLHDLVFGWKQDLFLYFHLTHILTSVCQNNVFISQ